MEDILASIRRIIADDQVQSQRPTGSGRRLGTPGTAPDPGPSLRARDMRGAQDDILDLARIRSGESEERAAARPAADTRPPTKLVDSAFPGATSSPEITPREPSPRSADPQRKVAAEPFHVEPTPSGSDPEGLDVASLHDAETYEPDTGTPARSEFQQVDIYGSDLAVGGATGDDALISAKPGAAVLSAFETLAATVVLQNDEMLERIMRDELRPLIKTWLDDNLPTMVERLVRSEIERVARGTRS